jgi:hypothetical protein
MFDERALDNPLLKIQTTILVQEDDGILHIGNTTGN